MRLCRFDDGLLGLVNDQVVYDVTAALDSLPSYRWQYPMGDALIAHLPAVCSAAQRLKGHARKFDLAQVQLRSPVANPGKIMAAPANYRLHVEIDAKDPAVHHNFHNKQLAGLDRPVETLGLFLKATSSVAGPSPGISLNWCDKRNDYEAELVVVIGKTGKNISARDAMEYIAGYCMGLDMSVRGSEERSFRKSADSYTVLGPWLTTADEVADPEQLMLWLTLNGAPRQRSSTAAMTVGIRRLIEIASSAYTLYPGDILMTGTPEGVGAVVPGDVIVTGCETLGEMTVPVGS
ncbi:fumarylacetoacetate hydrolase family protein [Bradyrhizobium paxllaeri]|uniref:fumarylacetoacetate hydrolase family protein n=1 Tax=Bradyrhizobium paxllaeri TaxID=190148 RepID=UPI00081064C8|nr:fumarylacetoacetate hydrolase family protein [Bradyrhizobium paxllaeri]